MPTEAIDWLKPSPFWNLAGQDFRQPDFFRPALLEFGSDDFMDQFFAAAAAPRPDQLEAQIARPPEGQTDLKLFQPAHGRFYLVCSSLCCRLPGFPDRVVAGAGESVFFVLRKLVDAQEYAWAGDETSMSWRQVSPPRTLEDDEQRLPMAETTTGGKRSIFFGYLPVSSSETYKAPAPPLEEDGTELLDTRIEELGARFSEPLTGQLDDDENPIPGTAAIQLTSDDLARTVSVYLLLEGWEFLLEPGHLPDVAIALRDTGAELTDDKRAEKEALLALMNQEGSLTPDLTLAEAFKQVALHRTALNAEGGIEGDDALEELEFGSAYDLKANPPDVQSMLAFLEAVRAALPDQLPEIDLPKITPQAGDFFVLRCVYERGQCDPQQRFVSLPSARFQFAPFFDPDAPARTIRIPLPGDVSIAGLRKFKKGVSFMMSDAMRRKMDSITGQEKALLKDEATINEGAGGLAFICSFSIQIIFIVAFFLLLIFVIVFNLIFWWIAFFKICFPIPKSLAPK